MAKRPLRLHFRLPPYTSTDRNKWRRRIHAEALKNQANVHYDSDDKLEVEVTLHFGSRALSWHDVDNRLKDVLDALQGRAGGSKKIRKLKPIIPNDRQVYRVVVEKRESPRQSRVRGHVTIRRLTSRR